LTINVLAQVIIVVGLIFDFFGCIGLVRLPDIYNRAQAATKCVTLGTCLICLGVIVAAGLSSLGMKALLCALFVLFTSPVAAHAIARGAYRSGVPPWEGTVVDEYASEIADAQQAKEEQ
jgi:multicomponent Na+:H+ antiporter subunit G